MTQRHASAPPTVQHRTSSVVTLVMEVFKNYRKLIYSFNLLVFRSSCVAVMSQEPYEYFYSCMYFDFIFIIRSMVHLQTWRGRSLDLYRDDSPAVSKNQDGAEEIVKVELQHVSVTSRE